MAERTTVIESFRDNWMCQLDQKKLCISPLQPTVINSARLQEFVWHFLLHCKVMLIYVTEFWLTTQRNTLGWNSFCRCRIPHIAAWNKAEFNNSTLQLISSLAPIIYKSNLFGSKQDMLHAWATISLSPPEKWSKRKTIYSSLFMLVVVPFYDCLGTKALY